MGAKETFARGFNKLIFQGKKHSPELCLIGAGVSAAIGIWQVVKHSRDGIKALDDYREAMADIEQAECEEATAMGQDYTEEDAKKDKTNLKIQTGFKFMHIYGKAILAFAASTALVLGSHHVMAKRNLGLATAYTALDSAFTDYRKQVKETFGEDVDQDLRYHLKAKEVEETQTDAKGKEKTVKTTKKVTEEPVADEAKPWRLVFSKQSSSLWQNDFRMNLMILRGMETTANEMLQAKGFLFANSILRDLGMKERIDGQVMGYVWDKNNPTYISFGLPTTPAEISALEFATNGNPEIIITLEDIKPIYSMMKTEQKRRQEEAVLV